MFYRSILAALAALVIASPVFADETTTTTTTTGTETTATTPAQGTETTAMATEGAKVDLNKATTKDLTKIKGLNAAKARAIVAYRKKHGEFKTLDELANVKGFKKMKPETMKEIQDQLMVQ